GVHSADYTESVTYTGDAAITCDGDDVSSRTYCYPVDVVDTSMAQGIRGGFTAVLPSVAESAFVPNGAVGGNYVYEDSQSGAIIGTYGKEVVALATAGNEFSAERYLFRDNPYAVGEREWALFPETFESPSWCPSGLFMFEHIRGAGMAFDSGDQINFTAPYYVDGAVVEESLYDRYRTDGLGSYKPMFAVDFGYRGQSSLLGARVARELGFDFGESVAMDRETISGGYSKVSWPSFVGWA